MNGSDDPSAPISAVDLLRALERISGGLRTGSAGASWDAERLRRLRNDSLRTVFRLLAALAARPSPQPDEWRVALARWMDRGDLRDGAALWERSGLAEQIPAASDGRRPAPDPGVYLAAVDCLSRIGLPAGGRDWADYSELGPWELGLAFEQVAHFSPAADPADGWTIGTAGRKSSGSYYTPRTMVRHIVRTALEPLLDVRAASTARSAGEPLRVLDPAMGSGFFLLEAAELILARHGGPADSMRETRRAIVRDSLFGVDVDPAAVEVAGIALTWWAEGERASGATSPSRGLRRGDALVGRLPSGGNSEPGWSEPPDGFDWAREFPEVFDSGALDSFGFDAVVGNPPYDNSRGGLDRNPDLARTARYARAAPHYVVRGAVDLYRLFLQRSLQVCRPGGMVAMIVPRSLMGDRDAAEDRRLLLDRAGIVSIDEFAYDDPVRRVFPGASLATCVVCARRGGPTTSFPVHRWPEGRMRGRPRTRRLRRDLLERFWPGQTPFADLDPADWSLLEQLHDTPWIGRLCDIASSGIGEVNSGYHKQFMKDRDTGSLLVRGTDLSPYHLSTCGTRKRWIDRDGFLGALSGAASGRIPWREIRVAKQAVKNISTRKRLVAALTAPGYFLADSTDFFVACAPYDPRYVLALFNSRTVPEWLFGRISTNNNVNLYQVRTLPAPLIDFSSDGAERRAATRDGVSHAEAWIDYRIEVSSGGSFHNSGVIVEFTGWLESRMAGAESGLPGDLHDLIVHLAQSTIDLTGRRRASDVGWTAVDAARIEVCRELIDLVLNRMYGMTDNAFSPRTLT